MKKKIVIVLRFVFAFVLYFGVAQAVGAKPNAQTETEYPQRPIRMIAVVTAGGGADIYARMLARKIGEALAQQVVVDNRGGANGVIGTELAVKAAPDGYALLFVTSAHTINAADQRRLPYDTLVDLAPISLFAEFGIFLVSYPGFPSKSVPELLALARARSGKMSSNRSPAWSEGPAMLEVGYPRVAGSVWYGLMVPAHTPREVIAGLNAESNRILATEEVRARLDAVGIEVAGGGTPEDFGKFIRAEIAKWAPVVKAAGIVPE